MYTKHKIDVYITNIVILNLPDFFQRFGVKVERNALVLESNPDFPYIGVGYDDGVLELFSVNEPEGIQSLVTFQLTRNPINSLHFTEISRTIVAADLRVGQFFIIEVGNCFNNYWSVEYMHLNLVINMHYFIYTFKQIFEKTYNEAKIQNIIH